jgi:hypothetical protein
VRGMAAQANEKIEVVRRACQQICPIYPDYAMRPIQDGFSWSSSLLGCAFERLYLVVFRSVRRRAPTSTSCESTTTAPTRMPSSPVVFCATSRARPTS